MVLSVVGARPNFMKTAPVISALEARGEFEHVLVHTGQHYDEAMSELILADLGVAPPSHMLGVGSGSHSVQTARVMERLEPILLDVEPDLVLVPGDVNSTLAAALVAAKLQIPVGHIEAGLRSFDKTMPEETNRLLTDAVAELLFIHSPEARENLLREGRPAESIHAVGNTMIDSLMSLQPRIEATDAAARHGLERGSYLLVTLHRPALVDGPLLRDALAALSDVAASLPVVFPVHPRTRRGIEEQGLGDVASNLRLLDPLGYLEFASLLTTSAGVLTDSGGLQEETTFLGIPCFTLRANTERPVTCEVGTNVVLGLEPGRIREVPDRLNSGPGSSHRVPDGWDGRAGERIADVISAWAA